MNQRIIADTESLCPVCLKRIPAQYIRDNDRVFMAKHCENHGSWKTLVWSDADQYEAWSEQAVHAQMKNEGTPVVNGCPFDCGLCGNHECGSCTVVFEITYRCNMHCNVCFADAGQLAYNPDAETIRGMYDAVKRQSGDCSIQMSGGEPTLREDLPELIRMGKEMGFSHIQVNTNGIRIAESLDYLQSLKDAGADLIYLQFDGTNDEIYRHLRGRDLWDIKQRAVANCEKAGIGIMLVPTIMTGVNLSDIGNIIEFAKAHMPAVKGVHFQPASFFGRYPEDDAAVPDPANISDVVRELERQTGGEIKESHIIPRKPFDGHCSFSGQYFLGEDGILYAISNSEQNRNAKLDITNFPGITNEFTNKNWRMQEQKPEKGSENAALTEENSEHKAHESAESRTRRFLRRLRTYSFSLSGMGFQDVRNIDIGRLKGCCVHVCSTDGRLIPLCAFHVTSINGERLYENI